MAYQVGTLCYDTALQAAQASASVHLGNVLPMGSGLAVVNVSEVTASSITYDFSPVGGGASTVIVSPYTAQPCNQLGTGDALTIGWLIAGTWLAVFAVSHIARIVSRWDSDHGRDS